MCLSTKIENAAAVVKIIKLSATRNNFIPKHPYNLIKKIDIPHFVFLSTNKKAIHELEIQKWAQGSQRREQMKSNFTVENKYIFYF